LLGLGQSQFVSLAIALAAVTPPSLFLSNEMPQVHWKQQLRMFRLALISRENCRDVQFQHSHQKITGKMQKTFDINYLAIFVFRSSSNILQDKSSKGRSQHGAYKLVK
jgi:hypothetical protein